MPSLTQNFVQALRIDRDNCAGRPRPQSETTHIAATGIVFPDSPGVPAISDFRICVPGFVRICLLPGFASSTLGRRRSRTAGRTHKERGRRTSVDPDAHHGYGKICKWLCPPPGRCSSTLTELHETGTSCPAAFL